MKTPMSELRKNGTFTLPNGGKLTRDGSKGVTYEGVQKVRATIKFEPEALDAAQVDQPMLVFLESLMELKYDDVASRVARLTPREMQVFGQMGMGTKNRKIAEDLGISTKTLDIHRANIGRKMALRTANAFGRVYWFFRMCNEFYPETLENYRKQFENE